MTSYYRGNDDVSKPITNGSGKRLSQIEDPLSSGLRGPDNAALDSMVIINDVPKLTTDDGLEDFDSISMSSSYSGEWEKLFLRPNYFKNLQRYGILGRLRSSRFRSVCWKLYLGVLPPNQSEWLTAMRHWRARYMDLRQKYITNPRVTMESCCDISKNNPLSLETESPWNQYFQDNELRVTIQQDVVRTFPEVEFFRDKHLHERMVDILFCVARHKMHLSYKQGMHELLAPMIFVLHCDHQAFLHACEIGSVSDVLKELLDPEYLEHDAFAMFCCVMDRLTEWYVSRDNATATAGSGSRMSDPFTATPFTREPEYNPSNVITAKLSRIQNEILPKFDPELKTCLETMDIPPQIYGIRWLRLLFGREFPMQDLLVLWDAIFADGLDRDLVDFLFVSLLVFLREAILSSDYSSCLLLLMRFPAVGDVHHFIDKALYLREPNQHPRPPDYFYQGNKIQGDASPQIQRKAAADVMAQAANRGTGFMSNFSTLTKKFNNSSRSTSGVQPGMKSSTDSIHSAATDIADDRRPGAVRKQSTGSLSLSGEHTFSVPGQRRVYSQQNIAVADSSAGGGGRVGGGALSQSDNASARSSEASSPSFDDVPIEDQLLALTDKARASGQRAAAAISAAAIAAAATGGAGGGGAKKDKSWNTAPVKHEHRVEELDFEVAKLSARLTDMETMCEQCADFMDRHIGKLQGEMLRQRLDREDEILLSIAGLKQVRDILKGTLRPSELFDAGQIVICEDHFNSPDGAKSQAPPITADGFVHIQPPMPGNGWGRSSNGVNGQVSSADAHSSANHHHEVELLSFKK